MSADAMSAQPMSAQPMSAQPVSVMERIQIVDSHTGGEPTRLVVAGGPTLGGGMISQRKQLLQEKYDFLRRAVVNEPRGSDVIVGGLLCEPSDPACAAAVIFFNNVGYLGMCGHGTIGLCATLAHMGRMHIGTHLIETPVGIVKATWHGENEASIENVPSYRKAKDVAVAIPGFGTVRGDVAWGGNWFFLVGEHPFELNRQNIELLADISWRIRQAINAQGFPEVDHVELFAHSASADAINFVLCPGKAYDRSPCGTGTSAKLACLAADGILTAGKTWIQESIIGSTFQGRFEWIDRAGGLIRPTIRGSAFVTAEATLLLGESDPFRYGIV
jgi:4-hydroxyproline epimerase